jgi:hypothetical protein
MEKRNQQTDLNIYPNPSSDILYLKLPDGFTNELEIEVTSITGRIVYRNTGDNTEIDVSAFQKGVYIIRVKLDRKVFVRRFLIQ